MPTLKPYPSYRQTDLPWFGEIPAHWEVKQLKRLFFVTNGSTPSSGVPEYWDGDIVWVTPEDLGKLENDTLYESGRRITKNGYQSCGTTLAPKGSLILSTRAPIGHLAIAGVEFCTNQGCRSLVFRSKNDVKYFYYLMLSVRSELQSRGTGTTFAELGKSKLEAIQLTLPPLPEQQAIAAYLDRQTAKIDALIAKKQHLLDLLAEQRAALISQAVTKGLPKIKTSEVCETSEVSWKDSGVAWLGQVPSHWEVLHLRRVINKFVDYRGHTPQKVDDGIPLITARNIKNGKIDWELSQEYIPEELYDEWMVRGFPEIGDVLVTMEAPLGETAQIAETRIALAQRIVLLKADKTKIENDYLKFFLASSAGQGELWSRATGSTAIGIKASHLKEIIVLVPPIEEQIEITKVIRQEEKKIFAMIPKVETAIERLREYRAALISSAVTGKIKVT